jgi:TPP-dependent pyruvate/acetoin dehydrogenase alpha subunit
LQARDPIPQLRKYLVDNKLATEEQINSWEKEVRA